MALTWDLTSIADYKNVCFMDDDSMNPVTRGIIFATMGVGIGDLTEKNAPEFYARLNALERASGTFCVTPDGPYFMTPADVQAHIGLKTNVFPIETRAKWLKRVFDSIMRDNLYHYNRETTKVSEEIA